MNGFWYLASPYSHPDPAVRQQRFDAVCRAAAQIMSTGQSVFCPIAGSHPIADHMDAKLRCDSDLWMRLDIPILRHAAKLVVFRLDGWHRSTGLGTEMRVARACRIPIAYMEAV